MRDLGVKPPPNFMNYRRAFLLKKFKQAGLNDIAYEAQYQVQEQGYPATETLEVFFVQNQTFEPLLKESLLLMQTEQCQNQHVDSDFFRQIRMYILSFCGF